MVVDCIEDSVGEHSIHSSSPKDLAEWSIQPSPCQEVAIVDLDH